MHHLVNLSNFNHIVICMINSSITLDSPYKCFYFVLSPFFCNLSGCVYTICENSCTTSLKVSSSTVISFSRISSLRAASLRRVTMSASARPTAISKGSFPENTKMTNILYKMMSLYLHCWLCGGQLCVSAGDKLVQCFQDLKIIQHFGYKKYFNLLQDEGLCPHFHLE